MKTVSVGLLLLLLVAAPLRADTASDNAAAIGPLIDDHSDEALQKLSQLSDLDRFQALRVLDRKNSTDVRTLYNNLDDAGRTQLLDLVQKSGAAGTAAGLQETGIVSDVDDTAIPTEFTPNGPFQFTGSPDFYKLITRGTDGTGDPGNLHFVSARLPALWPDTEERLKAAGMPLGTFDGDADPIRFAFGGLDGIQQSKIENIDLWLKLHPGQRFVFLGDSLQRDPEVYKWVLDNHPDQVEAVLIHRAGGPNRDPAAFKGETFFDTYADATKIVNDRGIPQPGARLPARAEDANGLPLPDSNVSDVKKDGFFKKVGDFFVENIGALFHRPKKTAAAPVRDDQPRSEGMTNLIEQRVSDGVQSGSSADDK